MALPFFLVNVSTTADQRQRDLLVGHEGQVLAEARNTVVTERDITGHPELKLARWAARELDRQAAQQTPSRTGDQTEA